MNYELPVAGKKVKPQQVTALHLFSALAFIGTGIIIYVYNFDITYWGLALLIVGLILATITVGKNKWLTQPKINFIFRVVEFLISASILTLSLVEQWKFPIGMFSALSAALVFSVFWERNYKQQLYVQISEEGIRMPVTARKRFIKWSEVDQVLVRFGTLSIDCLDNKLFQLDVSGNSVNAQEIETYCNTQVEKAIPLRVNNNW